MPTGDVLDKAHAFAFDCFRDNHDRLTEAALRLFQRFDHFLHIVPVDAQYFPAEASIFVLERIDVHDLAHRAVNLQTVLVDNADEVIELVMAGFHRGFPDLAFLLLTIAHDAERAIALLVELTRESNPDGNTQALPQ